MSGGKEEGKKLSGKQLISVLDEVCKEGTTVASDDFSGYTILDKETEKKYIHVSVNHSAGPYSVKYMQYYIDEMSFRQNNRSNLAVFETLPGQAIRKKAA
jgi:hypothetical protein